MIVLSNVAIDGLDEFFDGSEAPAADGLSGNFGKPSLHLINPGTAGGRKMQHVVRASGKPVAHSWRFVGG